MLLALITIFPDMEKFVIVPGSMKKKSLNIHSGIKQELPCYQLQQNPTYQIDSFNTEVNRKLVAKADFLVDK